MVVGDMSIVLDLRTVEAGRRVFNLLPSQVRAPFGVDPVQVSPASVTVEFEAAGLRSVPVQPEIAGTPASGYEVSEVHVEPKTVEIAGPVSAIQSVTAVTTEPVSIMSASRTVRQTVPIGVPSPNARLKTPQSAVVTVTIAPAKRQ
jgi:YbbR domain-containing protein